MKKRHRGTPGSTCVLTPEIATELVEAWADGVSTAEIIRTLRNECRWCLVDRSEHVDADHPFEAHKVWPADVTWWLIENRKVTIGGKEYGFHDLMVKIYPRRVMDLMSDLLAIAKKGLRSKKHPARFRNLINTYIFMITHMTPKHVEIDPKEMGWGVVVPENDAIFEEDGEQVN